MSGAATGTLLDAMFEAAAAVRANAHVPFCRFPVGACLKGEGPGLFVGANVENPVPSQSICAETAALGAMIAAGQRRLDHVVVIGGQAGSVQVCPPCGGCRQRLATFAHAGTMVHLSGPDGRRESMPFALLFPAVPALPPPS